MSLISNWVAFGIKKKFTFQSHFHFLPPSHTLSVPSLFFLYFPCCLPHSKKNYFSNTQTLTSFLFSSPSSLPFFEHTFPFFSTPQVPCDLSTHFPLSPLFLVSCLPPSFFFSLRFAFSIHKKNFFPFHFPPFLNTLSFLLL